MSDELVTERRGPVLIVRLNRPEARNALNPALMRGIGAAVNEAEADPEIRAVVVTGTGDRAFCAGLDLRSFAAGEQEGLGGDDPAMAAFTRLLGGEVTVPLVGAANATAVAGGFELLMGCDVIVASAEAKFGLPEVKRGLFPASPGTVLLGARVPLSIALEMTLTGDPIDAERAQALGLINAVVPPDQVLAVAVDYASRPTARWRWRRSRSSCGSASPTPPGRPTASGTCSPRCSRARTPRRGRWRSSRSGRRPGGGADAVRRLGRVGGGVMADVGDHYRRVRLRLTELLRGVEDEDWPVPVAACPGWTVHDVLGHLLGIVEDGTAGRITGPPNESQTAAQVERHRYDRPRDMLDQWADQAEPFEELITALEVWPAAMDVLAHEHDIRTALSRPGARDDALVLTGARGLIELLEVDGTITVDLGDETVCSASRPGPDYRVRTTPFEVFRFRLGRRSRDQVAGLDWSCDPDPILDELFMFGPASQPLSE
jgi:uncharacterized protein (TIGR03083 family)